MSKLERVYIVYGKSHIQKPACPEELFIGRFSDGKYHFLGCRPIGLDYILTDDRQSSEDWGIIKLPEGIRKLEKMIPNSTFTTRNNWTNITMTSQFIEIKNSFTKKSI